MSAARGTSPVCFRGARVIDGTGQASIARANVLVRGDHIERIDPADPPRDAEVIESDGLSLLPGFIDTHVHVGGAVLEGGRMWPLFRRFGVTTVRDVGGDPDVVIPHRDRERQGDADLPRIVCYGPLLDGAPALWGRSGMSRELTSVREAGEITSALIDRGVDGLKVYCKLPLELMTTIVEIARQRDVPVAGHVGAVTTTQAVDLGLVRCDRVLLPPPSRADRRPR